MTIAKQSTEHKSAVVQAIEARPRPTKIVEVNMALGDDPSLINSDPYGKGWLVKIKVSDKSKLAAMMDAAKYDAAHPV